MISLRKVYKELEQTNNLIKKIEEIKKNIVKKNDDLFKLKVERQQVIEEKIIEKKSILNKIRRNSENIYDWNKKNIVENFINRDRIKNKNGFDIDTRKGILIPSTDSDIQINYNQMQKNKKSIIFTFKEDTIINSVFYEFYDKNNLPLLPTNITLLKKDKNLGFYENFMRFYKKNTAADDFSTQTNISPKCVDKIIFEFDKEYDDQTFLIDFRLKEFVQNSEIIYEFDNVFDDIIEIESNFYSKYHNVDLKYSFDAVKYFNIDHEKITNNKNESIKIKISVNNNVDKIPSSEKKEIKYLKNLTYNPESENNIYNKPKNYIKLPNNFYEVLIENDDEKLQPFLEPFNEYISKISDKYIIIKDSLSVKNTDYISLFGSYYNQNEKIELVLFQVEDRLYIPEILIPKIIIRYEETVVINKYKIEHFAPMVFDLKVKG